MESVHSSELGTAHVQCECHEDRVISIFMASAEKIDKGKFEVCFQLLYTYYVILCY
jgi:hypothetical protein